MDPDGAEYVMLAESVRALEVKLMLPLLLVRLTLGAPMEDDCVMSL